MLKPDSQDRIVYNQILHQLHCHLIPDFHYDCDAADNAPTSRRISI